MKDLTQILPSKIIRMVCEFEGVTEEDLEVRNRETKYVMTRKLNVY